MEEVGSSRHHTQRTCYPPNRLRQLLACIVLWSLTRQPHAHALRNQQSPRFPCITSPEHTPSAKSLACEAKTQSADPNSVLLRSSSSWLSSLSCPLL